MNLHLGMSFKIKKKIFFEIILKLIYHYCIQIESGHEPLAEDGFRCYLSLVCAISVSILNKGISINLMSCLLPVFKSSFSTFDVVKCNL